MIQIRKANADDFPDLLVLCQHLWPTKPIDPQRLHEVYLRAIALPDRRYFCAVEGQHVVGLGSVSFKDSLWQEGMIAHIEEIVVREAMRGQGIGTALLEHIIAAARERGCRRVELDSAFHRKEAHQFYERHGFENRAYLFSKTL